MNACWLHLGQVMLSFMVAPIWVEVVRSRFSHGAAVFTPTTTPNHTVAALTPWHTGGQAGDAWLCGVVGCFLHELSVYFFAVLSHSMARNLFERQA